MLLSTRSIVQLGVLALVAGATLVGCRPRATRNARNARTTPQAATNGASPLSAKTVLNQADSALTRVSKLAEEDRETPPIAEMPAMGEYPRTPLGSQYIAQPNLSEYGTYEAALGAYNAHRYDEAISLFSQVATSGRPPELVPNAYYWMGESYYAMGDYAESMPYFQYVTQIGPQYKREMSLYKLSRANLRLGNRQGANMWYERLRNEYPRSSLARTLAKLGTR